MIEFQYFNDCPNAVDSLTNLRNALKQLQIPEENLTLIEVPDLKKAAAHNFQGSPTILVNGFDIYTLKKPEGFNYTCRLYKIEGKQTGIIPQSYIEDKISYLMERI